MTTPSARPSRYRLYVHRTRANCTDRFSDRSCGPPPTAVTCSPWPTSTALPSSYSRTVFSPPPIGTVTWTWTASNTCPAAAARASSTDAASTRRVISTGPNASVPRLTASCPYAPSGTRRASGDDRPDTSTHPAWFASVTSPSMPGTFM